MFRKILIANRGEIACRVITSCRKLGISTVVVYSDADADAKHVAMGDEAVRLGPAPVSESYLRADRIVEAAVARGAEAIHPGYGFLSENPEFVEAVEAAGIVFIGPPPSAIRAMGLKDAAKQLMAEAGVPIVPGYHGGEQAPDFLAAQAQAIGYPILIKARAGGGGKGMRLVEHPDDFHTSLSSAQREAAASFGDPNCLIEKYVAKPRHVEIQVFADAHGNVVHLFERDCSLQRRHQKVIEEAPAPGMTEAVRAAMGRAAVEVARAIGYRGAGTVEFIADGSRGLREDGFWFMEMNTRLQVEHPVSEAITGLDFVALQLAVASGEPLPFAQQDLKINGWAVEARLYAEDVDKGFLPATGRLEYLSFPPSTQFDRGPVRVDSGVRQGDTITPFYDPMVAKIIAHGPDRSAALRLLSTALANCWISGATTNVEFLSKLVDHEVFRAGAVDTGVIARHLDDLTSAAETSELCVALAGLVGFGLIGIRLGDDPWERLPGWSQWQPTHLFTEVERDGKIFARNITILGPGKYRVEGGTEALVILIRQSGQETYLADTGGGRTRFAFSRSDKDVLIFQDGRTVRFNLPDRLLSSDDDPTGGDAIVALMPGVVTKVAVKSGDIVARGDPLIVMEAMKMEQTLPAPRDGVVAEVLVSSGEQVQDGAVLLKLEPEEK
ncbi:acetyl/propionyl/methylcrotonyl-CoA carboxylase subunit alpha [Mesorhizobium sp. M0751]|uniref:acetyl/propionyl/methylcrotonyl-CoA carboxylase subunit alpha n=1 Tax=unclassified Mesorhizobium TaxID=325217 RepID=UPI00333CD33F